MSLSDSALQVSGPASAASAAQQHSSIVQGALDRARRLGISVSPPVRPRAASGTAASTAGSRAGTGTSTGTATPPSQASDGSSFDDLIRAAAAKEGVDPALVKAVARAESNLDPDAVSSAGAKGLMQLMDGTARSLGVRDSFDPAQNVAGGTHYLKQLLGRYGGDVSRALAAYNAGPGAVDRYGAIPPFKETQNYVRRVLDLRDAYQR
jgi:soluble lytic murein transglycosylase-like protein